MKTTNDVLYRLFEQKKAAEQSLIGLMHAKELDQWITDNTPAHKALYEKMTALSKKYFVHDEIGIVMSKPNPFTIVDAHGNKPKHTPKPVMNTNVTMADYENEFALLMAEEVEIVFN